MPCCGSKFDLDNRCLTQWFNVFCSGSKYNMESCDDVNREVCVVEMKLYTSRFCTFFSSFFCWVTLLSLLHPCLCLLCCSGLLIVDMCCAVRLMCHTNIIYRSILAFTRKEVSHCILGCSFCYFRLSASTAKSAKATKRLRLNQHP